jgi:hypothetical protein
MSYVAPVSAVLVMMYTASEATSAGSTTRRMGSVARSWARRLSRSSPSSGAGAAGCFESDARTAADHDDGLPGQLRFALSDSAAAGWRAAVIWPWSAFSAST